MFVVTAIDRLMDAQINVIVVVVVVIVFLVIVVIAAIPRTTS